jgi:hypothetical protein
MSKPSFGVVDGDGFKGLGDSRFQSFDGAGLGCSE